jgi:hypothetical protein
MTATGQDDRPGAFSGVPTCPDIVVRGYASLLEERCPRCGDPLAAYGFSHGRVDPGPLPPRLPLRFLRRARDAEWLARSRGGGFVEGSRPRLVCDGGMVPVAVLRELDGFIRATAGTPYRNCRFRYCDRCGEVLSAGKRSQDGGGAPAGGPPGFPGKNREGRQLDLVLAPVEGNPAESKPAP